MKVLYDTKIFEYQIFGGISLYFTKLFESFEQDFEVDCIFPCIYSDNYYIQDKSFSPKLRLYPKQFIFKKYIMKFLKFLNNQIIQHYIRKNDFDIFHPTYFDEYYLNNLSKPYVLTVHDMTVEAVKEFFIFDKKLEETISIKKKLIEGAKRIIAISENTKRDIIKYTNVNEDKIDVIYHAQPISLNNDPLPKEDLPSKYILYVGQRGKYKNFNNFFSSIKDLLINDKELHLVLAGGSPINKSEKEFIDSFSLNHKIFRTKLYNDNHLYHLYQNALCFVYPSMYEGFGFPILEAYYASCPLVCSNTSSFPEVAGDAAVFFDPYSEESMKEAISRVIYNKDLRDEMVIKGKNQLEKFGWDKTAALTKEVYKKALNE